MNLPGLHGHLIHYWNTQTGRFSSTGSVTLPAPPRAPCSCPGFAGRAEPQPLLCAWSCSLASRPRLTSAPSQSGPDCGPGRPRGGPGGQGSHWALASPGPGGTWRGRPAVRFLQGKGREERFGLFPPWSPSSEGSGPAWGDLTAGQ